MKTHSRFAVSTSPRVVALGCLLLAIGHSPPLARATIPEPDNLVWGVIYLGTNQVTSTQTNVVVEARRIPGGSTLARYRMGENALAGDYYSLALALESGVPVLDPLASQTGNTLAIVVLDGGTVRYTKSFTVGARGEVTRLDFGEIDNDHNGLLDHWEQHYFGRTGQNPNADPDGDALTNLQEQQNGTDPLTPDLRHPADLNPTNNWLTIHEVTAYALAWKTGQPWPIAPTNIDLNYVTRAGYLWKNGEEYRLDTNVAPQPPLWWVPGVQVRRPVPKDAEPAQSVITRALPDAFQPDQAVVVTLTAAPSRETACYAVEEAVPQGWVVSDISHDGQVEEVRGRIRWGPFFDREDRALTYQLTPASGADEIALGGAGSFDGRAIAVSGRESLVRAGFAKFKAVARDRGGENLRLALQGEPLREYVIETSDDLVNWQGVRSERTDANGRCEFTAPVSAARHGFYRAKSAGDP